MSQFGIGNLFKSSALRNVRVAATALLLVPLTACGLNLKQIAATQADDPSRIGEIDAATVQSISVDSETNNLGTSVTQTPSSCSMSVARATCAANSSSVLWSSCLLTSQTITLVLTGGWNDTFDSNTSCTDIQSGLALPNGGSVNRTATGGFRVALTDGIGLTTDTNAHTTYTGLILPTTGVTTTASSTSRSVVINGLHRILKSGGGTQLFEQSVVSDGITITGSLANANRVVNGHLTTYHDSSSYTAVSTFNNLTWGSSTCCFPTSGSVTSVLTGTYAGTQSMTFSSTCGQVSATSLTGTVTSATLSYCM